MRMCSGASARLIYGIEEIVRTLRRLHPDERAATAR